MVHQLDTHSVGRITTAGMISSYTPPNGPNALGKPTGMALGGDGAMWFTSPETFSIGRVTTPVTPEITGLIRTPGSREHR